MSSHPLPLDFNYAYGKPLSQSLFKSIPEDFQVHENLGFHPSGSGEHLYVQVTKRNTNTEWLARQLAKAVNIESRDVGYCGLKDRHAVTTQWFSLYLPKEVDVDFAGLVIEGAEVIHVTRHTHKLRRGQHSENKFEITLRDVSDIDDAKNRVQQISIGVPNYFGEQRFGIDGGNLILADKILVDRQKIKNRQSKFMAISSARSYLFNTVLSKRIELGNWLSLLDGEPEAEPSGPMWGRGRPLASGETLAIENEALQLYSSWSSGLEHVGLTQERRSLVCRPNDLTLNGDSSALTISFTLPPGQFATSVLRELTTLSEPLRAAR